MIPAYQAEYERRMRARKPVTIEERFAALEKRLDDLEQELFQLKRAPVPQPRSRARGRRS